MLEETRETLSKEELKESLSRLEERVGHLWRRL